MRVNNTLVASNAIQKYNNKNSGLKYYNGFNIINLQISTFKVVFMTMPRIIINAAVSKLNKYFNLIQGYDYR